MEQQAESGDSGFVLEEEMCSVKFMREMVLALALIGFTGASAAAENKFREGEVLVGVRGNADADSLGVGKAAGKQEKLKAARIKLNPGLSVSEAIARLSKNPNVEYAEPNYIRHKTATPNDTHYSKQYALIRAQANQAWDLWKPQGKAVVAVVDTGVQYSHPDLTNVLLRDGSNNVVGYNALTWTSNANDDEGHGTHVAGIAAAQINNATGIAGVAGWNPGISGSANWVRILPVKVLDSYGYGDDAGIADGIVWAADRGANAVNLSLGGSGWSNTLNNAVQYAWSKGAVVVAAAGNSGVSSVEYPAGYDNVISVAATDSTDTLASFSQYGSWVDVAAPGDEIASTYFGSGYAYLSGTSMAAPFVAGQAALLKAHNPALTGAQLSSLITSHTDAVSPYGANTIGGGRVNVLKSLQAATPATFTLSASTATVTAGGSLSVSWTAPGSRTASDWIALYKTGADNRQYGWWKYTEGAASGTFSLTAPMEAGDYEFRYLLNNGYTDAARSAVVKVEAPVSTGSYSLAASPGEVSPGGTVTVNWTAPAGRPASDWIGLYKVGASSQAYGWWRYTNGAASGSFSVPMPAEAGSYEFRYLLNNGFTESARSGAITVGASSGSAFSLTPSATSVQPGSALSMSWTAPSGRPVNDWIGLFKVGDPYTAYAWWTYTNGAVSGTANLTAPGATGTYEFRYFQGGSIEKARSAPVTVGP